MGYMILLYSLSSYGTQVVKLSQGQASILTAVLNLGTAFGRPCIGFASDRISRIGVAAVLTLFNGVIIFAIWLPSNSFGLLIFFALVSGATMGTFWMVRKADASMISRLILKCRPSDHFVQKLQGSKKFPAFCLCNG